MAKSEASTMRYKLKERWDAGHTRLVKRSIGGFSMSGGSATKIFSAQRGRLILPGPETVLVRRASAIPRPRIAHRLGTGGPYR